MSNTNQYKYLDYAGLKTFANLVNQKVSDSITVLSKSIDDTYLKKSDAPVKTLTVKYTDDKNQIRTETYNGTTAATMDLSKGLYYATTSATATRVSNTLNFLGASDVAIDQLSSNPAESYNGARVTNLDFSKLARKATTLTGYGITDALPKSGGTLTGSLTLDSNAHISFKRTDWNYLIVPEGDYSAIAINQGGSGGAKTLYVFDKFAAYPYNSERNLGKSSNKWNNVYANKFIGDLQGNADSATKLQTARTLWGRSFDGTGNVDGNITINISQYPGIKTISSIAESSHYFESTNTNQGWAAGTGVWSVNGFGIGEYKTDQKCHLSILKSSGNVGIGTTSPTEKLEVSGNVKATTFKGNLEGTATYAALITATSSSITHHPGDYHIGYSIVGKDSVGSLPCGNNANGILTINTHGGNYLHQLGFTSTGLYHRIFNDTALNTTNSWNKIAYAHQIPTDYQKSIEWYAPIKGHTWSRLCYVVAKSRIIGNKFILNIACTRTNVVYNIAFIITTHHNKQAHIAKISGSKYSYGVQIRALSDSDGNSYIDIYDESGIITAGEGSAVTCTFIPIYAGAITKYESFTDGSTIPDGYNEGKIITNNDDFQGTLDWSYIQNKPVYTLRNSSTPGKIYLQSDGVDIANATINLPNLLPVNSWADANSSPQGMAFTWINPYATGQNVPAAGNLISCINGQNNGTQFLTVHDSGDLYYRGLKTSGAWGDWKKIAFTDSNVASATRADAIKGYSTPLNADNDTPAKWIELGTIAASCSANALSTAPSAYGILFSGAYKTSSGGEIGQIWVGQVGKPMYRRAGNINGWWTTTGYTGQPWIEMIDTLNLSNHVVPKTGGTFMGNVTFDGVTTKTKNINIESGYGIYFNRTDTNYINIPDGDYSSIAISQGGMEGSKVLYEFGKNAIYPNVTKTKDLGTINKVWNHVYAKSIGLAFNTGIDLSSAGHINPGSATLTLGEDANRWGAGYFSGEVYASGGFYESSDERLKTFGSNIDVDFKELAKIRKSHFIFNDKPEQNQIGVSAQEIQKLYPAVVTETSDGYLNVDYAKLSVIALAAIDKLNERIEYLESKIK